ANLWILLRERVGVHTGVSAVPAEASAALGIVGLRSWAATGASARRRGLVLVRDALRVGAAVALELRFDPVDGGAIPIRALAPVAELRETLDRRLVFLQLEPGDHVLHGVARHRVGDGRTGRLLGVRKGS